MTTATYEDEQEVDAFIEALIDEFAEDIGDQLMQCPLEEGACICKRPNDTFCRVNGYYIGGV